MPSAPSTPASRAVGAIPQPMRWRGPATRTSPVARPATAAPGAVDHFDVAFHIFCVWTFILLARPQDYVSALVPLRLALVFTGLTALLTIGRGTGLNAASVWCRESKLYFAFFAAMCAGIPFAVHRGRAFDAVVMGYIVNMMYFVMFLLHVNSWARFKRVLMIIMVSALLFAYFETTLGDFRVGRYYRESSTMYDSNDVAYVALSFLPFLLSVGLGRFGTVTKGTATLGALSLILLALYTGSRGGFLGLAVMFVLFLGLRIPQMSGWRKLLMVAVLLLVAITNADKMNVERFMSIVSPGEDYNMSDEWGRKELWKRGIIVFLHHPLTGVGAENFSEAIGAMRSEEGLIPKWQPSHNAFVQVLTETGIFGFSAFVLLIVACLKGLNRLRRTDFSATYSEIGALPGILQIGFIAQLVSAFFLTQGYSIFLTLSFAAASSLTAIAGERREALRA